MTDATHRLTTALADRYRIERELGAGGMATVFLAEDLKHKRHVALKVLKPELAAVLGAERFVQEITTTAALQHPHILPLFDSGTADGFLYYVMPFIDGETLRGKLDRETQLGVEEAVRIARDVASALQYAHTHGVIHRDIKPENILLHDGRPMVADFGIALAVSAAAGGRMTETGLSLGTPHYMSPEQATAEKEISGRSDVYSVGCVLYEMLTGDPPHTGSSAQQIIMKIITEPAQAVTQFRKSVPPNVAAAVAKSLEKLPADRFATAKEFGDALANPAFSIATGSASYAPTTGAAVWHSRTGGLTLAAAAMFAVVAAWGWLRAAPETPLHVSIPAPPGTQFPANPGVAALSPDGHTVVFAAVRDGVSRLYRRPVNGFRSEPIAGTEGAERPFFSPDGEWVGYFTPSREIRKVALRGGESVRLTSVPFWQSKAFWRRNGTIAVMSDARGLFVIPDHGGTLTPLTPGDSAVARSTGSNSAMSLVQELSDGTLVGGLQDRASADKAVVLATLAPDAKQWATVLGATPGQYLQSGFLLTRPGSELLAARFNLKNGKTTGTAVPVLEGSVAELTVNERGDVAYFASPNAQVRVLALVDRAGVARRVATDAGNYRHPRLSPDGMRLAVNLNRDLWIIDLRTSVWTRLTTNASITEPQWSADSRRLIHTVFDSTSGFNPPVWRATDGSGVASIIRSDLGDAWTSDWSRDGNYVVTYGGKVGQNVTVVDFDAPHALHVVTQGEAVSRNARFSPDGRWLAYQSNETGRMQIYVISYPGLQDKQVISTDGGTEPAWRPNGGELYFRNGQSMMAVTVQGGARLAAGTPRELFRGPFPEDLYGDRSYDVMPDGEHFLMFQVNPDAAPELRVIRNWAAELKATVGGK